MTSGRALIALLALLGAVPFAAAQTVTDKPAKGVRLIAPELIAPAPATGDLERLPAILPPAKAKPAPMRAVAPDARQRLLHLPIAEAAGVFTADGYRIALAGLGPADPEELCGEERRWNCGASARTAFRAFLRGRSVRCRVPEERPSDAETLVTQCSIAGQDPASWLVAQGWARRSGEDYASEEEEARAHRRGFFGSPPPAYAPVLPSISAQVSGTP